MNSRLPNKEEKHILEILDVNGFLSLEETVFETGCFSGNLCILIQDMITKGWIAFVHSSEEVNYCVTGLGLEAIYIAQALEEAADIIIKNGIVDFARIRIRIKFNHFLNE